MAAAVLACQMPGLAGCALPVPSLALVQMPCQVDKGRVGNACHKEDDVAGGRNGYHGSGVIDPKERPPGEQYGIDKLREQSRAVVPQPQEFLGIPKLFSRKGPPFMVSPDVKKLDNDIYGNPHKHQPGRIGKYCADGRRRKIILIWRIQEPGLANQDKCHRSRNPQIDSLLCSLFPVQLA